MLPSAWFGNSQKLMVANFSHCYITKTVIINIRIKSKWKNITSLMKHDELSLIGNTLLPEHHEK